jgi:hypothetical protein
VSDCPRGSRLSLNCMGGSFDLNPELYRDAPLVQHVVLHDGANVQILIERWWCGDARVKDCFPPGLTAALKEVRRLRARWTQIYPRDSEFALSFADWLEEQIRSAYASAVMRRPSRLTVLRRGRVRFRRNTRNRSEGR